MTCFSVLLLLASTALALEDPLDALQLDDACALNPESEECSASFRQLRGLQLRAEAQVNDTEDEEPGVCCYSGEDSKNVCGTCFPTAIAPASDKQCSKKKNCAGCGGTWCRSVCAMGAADPSNKCGTAFEDGLAEPGSYCAQGPTNCASCNGDWCQLGLKTATGDPGSKKDKKDALEAVAGFCCYRSDSDEMCGACDDVAKDAACSTKANCGDCGGHWCEGPKCVVGWANDKNPCGSAFPEGGVSPAGSYCSKSEADCGKCSGEWCKAASIKFVVPGTNETASDASDIPEEDEPRPAGNSSTAAAEEEEAGEEEDEVLPSKEAEEADEDEVLPAEETQEAAEDEEWEVPETDGTQEESYEWDFGNSP